MGDEIHQDHFDADDYRLFQQRLEQEMAFVRELFAARRFDQKGRNVGYELELCLLDQNGFPAPCNQQVLQKADNPLLTVELARFNLEINGHVFPVKGTLFSSIQHDLSDLYRQVERAAASLDAEVGLFGVLPSLGIHHLDAETYMSDLFRYRLLNERLMQMRQHPIHLEINGVERLQLDKEDVMLEALGTSLQVHYQIPFEEAVDSYHAALWASMAILAAAANSPLVLHRRCWQESRIAIFKQAVDTRNREQLYASQIPRVNFARGYISSWLELFEENQEFSPVLPEVSELAVEQLHHFNLHNGTIWRWIRPIIGVTEEGYHLRLELRVVPAGPTLIDSMANMVFYIGLIEGLKLNPEALTQNSFDDLERDFYRVAREGLAASVNWCSGEQGRMQNLLLESIIPLAYRGLDRLGIQDSAQWMAIIEQRVTSCQTGANWISEHWQKHRDGSLLVRDYQFHARQNIPVHRWPAP